MIEEIDFQDTNNKVSVTIDNETQSLPIKKINKLPTYIDLNKSLNTALENNIEVDALICIKHSGDSNATEENPQITNPIDTQSNQTQHDEIHLNIDGIVTITIYNNEEIYYIKDVKFQKGHIIDSIENKLPLGNYIMVIQYNGNKYFEESNLTINFNVEKRLGICKLYRKRYYGNFLERINISGELEDNERKTPIKNCSFEYSFNGERYLAKSNINGEFTFSITIPEPDISHCNLSYEPVDESEYEPGELNDENSEEGFIDEDGNIKNYLTNIPLSQNIENHDEQIYEYPEDPDIKEYYPNASYILKIYDDEAYYFNNAEIEIIANKAPTHIIIDSVNPGDQTNILQVAGAGLATYNNKDNDIKYGKVSIELPELNYKHDIVDIKNGLFAANINLADVYNVYNKSEIETLDPYDTTNIAYTSINVTGDSEVKSGDTFTIKATVTSTDSTEYVKYGILIFYLYDDNDNIIYHYETEIDRTGVGIFNFNTSQPKKYNIKVEYVGMFGYQNSISNKYQITVI